MHRHCELPLKHYKQRGKKSNESLSFPSTTCRPPHRLVCFVVYCYTNVHQYRKTFRFPLAQRAWHIRKTKKHTTWICCCCSTFVAMLCPGVNNLVFQWQMITSGFQRETAVHRQTRPKQTSVSHLRLMRQTVLRSSVLAYCFPFTTMVSTPPCRPATGGVVRARAPNRPTPRPGPAHHAQNSPLGPPDPPARAGPPTPPPPRSGQNCRRRPPPRAFDAQSKFKG